MKTPTVHADPATEEALRRDLRALADQLCEGRSPATLGPTPYGRVGPRPRRWVPAVAAAALVLVVGAGVVLAARDDAAPTSTVTTPVAEEPADPAVEEPVGAAEEPTDVADRFRAEREVQRARTADDVRVHTAAVDALTERWGATFAPDAIAAAVAVREESWDVFVAAAEDGAFDDQPEVPEDLRDVGLPETVGHLQVEGASADGHRLTVSVGTHLEPTADLGWVDRWVADSLHEPVPVPDGDVQVWSYAWPVDGHTGLGGQMIDVFTTQGIVSIHYEHEGDTPTVQPEAAVAIARAAFDLPRR